MQLAISGELYAYWDALRAGRSAPERNDIEPGAIRGILADTFVLDFDPQGGFPFRIAGSRANALFGTELRGLSFLELWREADRQAIRAVLQRVANDAEPTVLRAEARPPGLDSLQIEATLLPLRHHGSTHSRILGAIAVEAAPHWVFLVGAGPARLISASAPDGAKSPAAGGTPPAECGSSVPKTRSWRGHLIFGWRDSPRT
jgi:hypothetical protein